MGWSVLPYEEGNCGKVVKLAVHSTRVLATNSLTNRLTKANIGQAAQNRQAKHRQNTVATP